MALSLPYGITPKVRAHETWTDHLPDLKMAFRAICGDCIWHGAWESEAELDEAMAEHEAVTLAVTTAWFAENAPHAKTPHTHPNGPICGMEWCGSPRKAYR